MRYDLKDISQSTDAKQRLRKLIEKGKTVEITVKQKQRSIPLNSFLHVCISLFAINFGYTIEEAKTLLKRQCDFMVYEKKGIKFLRKTSKLDNLECSKFVEWIRNYSSQNGYYICDADEYKKNRYAIDNEINNNKEFL